MKDKDTQMLEEAMERVVASTLIPQAFKVWVQQQPELTEDPKVKEAIMDYHFGYYYDNEFRENQLILGTIIAGGGDYLYDVIQKKGLIEDLRNFIEQYVSSKTPPTKKPRIFKVIPYSDYRWNEDDWGEDL